MTVETKTIPKAPLLPQGPDFHLINRVTEFQGNSIVEAEYDYKGGEIFCLDSHFPSQQIMPGCMILEGMNQTAIQLCRINSKLDVSNCRIIGADNLRFKRPVMPPAVIKYQIQLLKEPDHHGFGSFHGEAYVGGKLVAEGDIMFAVIKN